jgi:hypothetical protein
MIAGESGWGEEQQIHYVPPANPGGQCTPTPPWWDVDFICTKYGWRKVKTPVYMKGGEIVGPDFPPGDWKPLAPCPQKCPLPAPPPPPAIPPSRYSIQ